MLDKLTQDVPEPVSTNVIAHDRAVDMLNINIDKPPELLDTVLFDGLIVNSHGDDRLILFVDSVYLLE